MLRYPIPTAFTLIALPYMVIGYFFEVLIFWLFAKKYVIRFWHSAFVVLIANLFSAFAGLFVALGTSFTANILWYLGFFVISAVIEAGFYIAYFYKGEIRNWRLITASVLGNLITFVIAGYGIFINPVLTEKYLPLLGIQFF